MQAVLDGNTIITYQRYKRQNNQQRGYDEYPHFYYSTSCCSWRGRVAISSL